MFEIFNNTSKEIEEIKKLEKYIEFIVKKLELEKAIFNIIFVDNEEIHNINKEYRNIDRVTDVISFALEDNKDIVYEDFRLLGDIYIAIDVAYDQAIEYNHSREREVCFLATHGILHLLGYDHMTIEEEKEMFDKQEELLNEFEIKR
ncbi:MAG: rRNA maturation RNase YbeY [Bacilli bacterium]|nr:rRNA maturation RNase YbeY [Bacilli bacterium]